MTRTDRLLLRALLSAAAAAALPGCGDRFSPDTYATRAVQQADKVEQGIVVGVRPVRISAEGTTGAATGAAAGGVLGAQAPAGGIVSALGGVGGALVGGLLGKGAEHTVVDTGAYEYIVRTTKNELMRVTQQDREPLRRGQAVLLITGVQARIVPDYTLTPEGAPAVAAAVAGSPAGVAALPVGATAGAGVLPGGAPDGHAVPAPASVVATPLPPVAGAPAEDGADRAVAPAIPSPAEASLVPAYPSVPPPPPAPAPATEGRTPRPGAAAAGADGPEADGQPRRAAGMPGPARAAAPGVDTLVSGG